jgi:hypothetical protein
MSEGYADCLDCGAAICTCVYDKILLKNKRLTELEAELILEKERNQNNVANYSEQINHLRQCLWHLHPATLKYGDDGEMQCMGLDYKRQDIDVLIQATTKALQRYIAQLRTETKD